MNEEYMARLKEEFPYVYEWTDAPNTTYPSHSHKGKVSWYVAAGSITMIYPDKQIEYKANERADIPVGVEHTAIVGPDGCTFIVGEEIEGDS